MHSSIYHQLQNKTVRDLFWILFSESPLNENYDLSPFAMFPNSILTEWKKLSVKYFLELDQHPHPLVQFVNRRKNNRLGFYAEALLSYFFQTFKSVELLLQNYQIIEHQRTIGEVDFIIAYKNEIIHLECAVKYYLLKDIENSEVASQWVGPRLKDNLALKLDKMINHQLRLGKRKKIQNVINSTVDGSYLFLKGIFFAENQMDANRIIRHPPKYYIRRSNLINCNIAPLEILNRPNWLSSTLPTKLMDRKESIDFKEDITNPQLILFEDKEVRFIVPDDWGKSKVDF